MMTSLTIHNVQITEATKSSQRIIPVNFSILFFRNKNLSDF